MSNNDALLLKHSQVFNQRMTFLRASRLSFAPFFGVVNDESSRIFLDLPENFYIAGETVSGSIYIELKNKLTYCDLTVASTGLEELRVYSNFRLSSEKSGKIYAFSAKIRYWKELLPGTYKVPISLKLPKFCPASFYFSDEDQDKNYIKASISYILTVTLSSKETELFHNIHLTIKSASSLTPSFEELEKKSELRSCACWVLGHTTFLIRPTSKHHSSINSNFEYKLLVNNSNCSKAINSICSQIVRVLRFRTNRQEFKIKSILNRIHRKVQVAASSGIVESPDFLFNHSIAMGSEDINTSSTEGKLVYCKLFLEIFVFYTGKFRNSPKVLLIDLFVDPETGVREKFECPLVLDEEPEIKLIIED